MSITAKYDREKYKYYVLVDGKIHSGSESQWDAEDRMAELRGCNPGKPVCIAPRGLLLAKRIYPDIDSNWIGE